MSLFLNTADRNPTVQRPRPVNEAVLRATAVLSLLAIGAIHFLQIVPTTEQTPLLGVSFLFLIAGSVVLAARLATHHDRLTWAATAALTGAAIGGYLFTRIFNTPLDNQDAGNWSCMLGLAALFVEANLLGFCLHAVYGLRAAPASIGTARSTGEIPVVRPSESSAA